MLGVQKKKGASVGLDVSGVKLMFYAKKCNVNFESTLTLGRQGLYLPKDKVKKVANLFESPFANESIFYNSQNDIYSDNFFRALGATNVYSIDNSDYEGATYTHDMNTPIQSNHHNKYSAVVDIGTLEHIFNFSTAIKNAMQMVSLGGHFISLTVANNFLGHGFYQFSPELFFSVFKKENGFVLEHLIMAELYEDSTWYHVTPPKGGVFGRVTLCNHTPTYIMCIAKKINTEVEIFNTIPQQNDYQEAWENTSDKPIVKHSKNNGILMSNLKDYFRDLPGLANIFRNIQYLKKEKFPTRDYTPFNPTKKD